MAGASVWGRVAQRARNLLSLQVYGAVPEDLHPSPVLRVTKQGGEDESPFLSCDLVRQVYGAVPEELPARSAGLFPFLADRRFVNSAVCPLSLSLDAYTITRT